MCLIEIWRKHIFAHFGLILIFNLSNLRTKWEHSRIDFIKWFFDQSERNWSETKIIYIRRENERVINETVNCAALRTTHRFRLNVAQN